MKKSIISFMLTAVLGMGMIPTASANDTIHEYFNDFNKSDMTNVFALNTLGVIAGTYGVKGEAVYLEQKPENPDDLYLKLDNNYSDTPQFVYKFDEIKRGKVVVEADIKLDNLTPTRPMFEVLNADQQPVVRLESYQYYFRLCYGNTSVEINEIPINNEWHHYMAVIDCETDTFRMYIDGRPTMGVDKPTYKGNTAKKGLYGFKSSINKRNILAFDYGETGVDNIKVYSLAPGEVTEVKSDILDFDYEYLTVSGAYKGMTAGEFLSEIDTEAQIEVKDNNFVTRNNDECLNAKDTLVVTKGNKRSFYSIRLSQIDYHAVVASDSPELFLQGERSQFDDDDSSVCARETDGKLYIPLMGLRKIFDADVIYDNDINKSYLQKDNINLCIHNDETAKNIDGRLYVDFEKYAELFSYNFCYTNGIAFIDKTQTAFKTQNENEFIKAMFTFKKDENATVIKDFSSIEEAVEKANALWENGLKTDIIADMGDKTYFTDKSIVIDNSMLKYYGYNLIFRGNKDNHASITGGVQLDPMKFKKLDNSKMKSRLPESSADKVLVYDLKKSGLTDIGTITSQGHTFEIKPSQSQLYLDDKTQTLAKYPNEGYMFSGKSFNGGYGWGGGGFGDNEIEYLDERIESWDDSEDWWAFGFWNDEYSPGDIRISNIDRVKNSMTFDGYMRGSITKSDRAYYIYNVFEELDIPGEYYIDKDTLMLYYYPTEDFYKKDIWVSKTNDILLTLDNVSNVIFENVDFTYTRDMGAKTFWCRNILFRNCDFQGMGTYGVIFRESQNSGLYGCYFNETGGHSAMVEGGDLTTLTKSDNFVINSKFNEVGYRRKTYSGCVLTRGAGNYIYKNRIQNSFHMGIYVFGSQHYIKNNSFYNICYQSGDAGAIYMYARWSTSQLRVEGNYFEHMRGTPEVGAGSNAAIYYDNSTSHTKTYGNVFYDLMSGVWSNCGRENEIKGNVFSDMIVNSGMLNQNTMLAIYDTVNTIPYKGKIWTELNPKLSSMQYDYNPTKAKNTTSTNNVYNDSNEFSAMDPTTTKQYANKLYREKTDVFADKDNKDFRLLSVSDYLNTYVDGEIDYKNMGPGKDMTKYRKSDLSRLYVYTDTTPSSCANIYLDKDGKTGMRLYARSTDDDYVDLQKAHITYDSSDENVVRVSPKGMIYYVGDGKATVSAVVTLNGITKKAILNVYTDKYMWDIATNVKKEPLKVYIDSNLTELSKETQEDKGTLFVPIGEIFGKLGFEFKEQKDGSHTYSNAGKTVVFKENSDTVALNGSAVKCEANTYISDETLYVPYSFLNSLGLITIYSEGERTFKIFNINKADGTQPSLIPEGTELVDLSEKLVTEPESFSNEKAARYKKDGNTVTFGEDSASGLLSVFSYEKEKLPQNAMAKFNYKLNTNAYASIMLRAEQANCVPWRVSDVDCYFIVIKKDVIEVQKRINNSQAFILDSLDNKGLSFDKWHEVTVGVFKEDDGTNRIILNSDGKNIVDVKDDINYSLSGQTRALMDKPLDQIDEPGYISFGIFTTDSGAQNYVSLK